MRYLIIAPLAPPLNGNSFPLLLLQEELQKSNKVDTLILNKNVGLKSGFFSWVKVLNVFVICLKVTVQSWRYDKILLTTAETKLGNARDLLIYISVFIHIEKLFLYHLGGAHLEKTLFQNSLRRSVNSFFLNRVGGIIVEGRMQELIFSNIVKKDKITVVRNFADDYIFISSAQVEKKFSSIRPLKILFLSNLLPGKGHEETLEAFTLLDNASRKLIELDFVGDFENCADRDIFLSKLANYQNVKYHGRIDGEEKKDLFHNSHIFCLPTYYPYEGQPFVILEAYASGNFVITTHHASIPEIFIDGENGVRVNGGDSEGLKNVFIDLLSLDNNRFKEVANHNLMEARRNYNKSRYLNQMIKFIDKK